MKQAIERASPVFISTGVVPVCRMDLTSMEPAKTATDEILWCLGVAAVTGEFRALLPAQLSRLSSGIVELRARKKALHDVVARFDGAAVCAECRGECCVRGKYHFSAIDLVVYLQTGRTLFEPRFANGLCPFLGDDGCLMPLEYRPLTCVIFVCERIEALFAPADRKFFSAAENDLRLMYGELQEIFADRRMRGSVMNYPPAR
jgi:hypothetical protein